MWNQNSYSGMKSLDPSSARHSGHRRIATSQRRPFRYRNVALTRVLDGAVRVCRELHKCAHRGYKSFKPKQTGWSTGYPVPSGCRCLCFLFLPSASFSFSLSFSSFSRASSQESEISFLYLPSSEAVYVGTHTHTHTLTGPCNTVIHRVSRNSTQ